MSAPSFEPSAFAVSVLAWQVMMTAMMVPVALPWVRTFARLTAAPAGAGGTGAPALVGFPVWLFAGGYLTVWLGFGVAGALAQTALGAPHHGGPPPTDGALGAALLLVAGAYQLTPAKAACLRHCRNPLSYLLERWRNGPPAPYGVGLRHGIFCLGCCWALMALALAVGVMDLLWMAGLSALVAVENLTRWGPRVGRAAGWLLLAGGAGRALALLA